MRREKFMSEIGPAGGAGPTPAVIYDFSRARAKAEVARQPEVADTTGFTDEALELARARQTVDAAADVRAAKVEALRTQVQNGEYKPDPNAIAEKLMRTGF